MADETRKPYIIELLADKTKFVKELRGLDWEDIIGLKGRDLANVLTKAGSEGGDALAKELMSIDINWDDVLNSKKFKSAITKIVGDANRQFRAGLVDKKGFAEITAFIGEMNSAMAEFGTGWDTKGAIRSLTAFAKAITPIRAELEALAEAPEKVKRTFENVFGDKGLNITPNIDTKSVVNEAETVMSGVGKVVATQAHKVSKSVEQAYRTATSTISTLTSSRASSYNIKTQQHLQKMLNGLREEYKDFMDTASWSVGAQQQTAYRNAAKAAKDYLDLVKWADSSAAEAQGLVRGNFVSVSDYDMQEMKAAIDAQIKYAEQQIQRYEEEVQNAFQLNLADKLTENLKSLNLKVSLPKDAKLTRQINDTIKRINKKRLETIKTTIDVSRELNPKTNKERTDIDAKTVSAIEKKFGAIDQAIYDKQQSILANTREWRKNMQDAIVQGGANSIAFGFKWDPTDFDSEASNLYENLQDFFTQEDHKIALRIDEEALLNSVKGVLGDKTIAVGGGGSVDINAESIKEAIKSGIRDAIFGGVTKTTQTSHSSKKQPPKDEDDDTPTAKHTIDVNKAYTTYLIDTLKDIAKTATRENKNGGLNQKQKDVLGFFAGKGIDLRNLGSTDEEIAKLLEDALLTTDEQGKIRGSDLVDAIKNFQTRSKVQWKSIDELTRAVRILLTSFGEEAEYESSKEIDRESEKIIRDASKKAKGVRGLRNIKNYYNRSSGQYNEQKLPDADNIEQILALTKDMETDGLLNEQLTILKEARAKLGDKTDEQSIREFQEVYQDVWSKIEGRFYDLTNYLKAFSGELNIKGRKDPVKFNNKTRASQNRTIGTLANLKEDVIIEHAEIYTSPNDQSLGLGIKSPKTGRVSQGQERSLLKGTDRTSFTVRDNHEDETDVRYSTYKAIDDAVSSYFNRENLLQKLGLPTKPIDTQDKTVEGYNLLIKEAEERLQSIAETTNISEQFKSDIRELLGQQVEYDRPNVDSKALRAYFAELENQHNILSQNQQKQEQINAALADNAKWLEQVWPQEMKDANNRGDENKQRALLSRREAVVSGQNSLNEQKNILASEEGNIKTKIKELTYFIESGIKKPISSAIENILSTLKQFNADYQTSEKGSPQEYAIVGKIQDLLQLLKVAEEDATQRLQQLISADKFKPWMDEEDRAEVVNSVIRKIEEFGINTSDVLNKEQREFVDFETNAFVGSSVKFPQINIDNDSLNAYLEELNKLRSSLESTESVDENTKLNDRIQELTTLISNVIKQATSSALDESMSSLQSLIAEHKSVASGSAEEQAIAGKVQGLVNTLKLIDQMATNKLKGFGINVDSILTQEQQELVGSATNTFVKDKKYIKKNVRGDVVHSDRNSMSATEHEIDDLKQQRDELVHQKEQEYLQQLITNSKLSEEVLAELQAESEARRKRYDAFSQLDQVESNLSLARQKRNDANSRINYVEEQRGKLERFGLSARGTYANDVLNERKKAHANDFFSSDWYYEEVKRIRQETTEEMQEVEKKIQQKHKQWRQIVDKEKEAVIREFASESVDLDKVRSSAEEEFTKSKKYKAVTDLQGKKKDKKLQEIQTTIDNEVKKMVDEAMTYQADAIEAEAKDIAKKRGRTTVSEKDYKDATDRVRANVAKVMANRVEAQHAGEKASVESEMRIAIENAIVQSGERAVQQAINEVIKGKDKQVGQRIYDAISTKEAKFRNNPKFQGMTGSLLTDLDIAQQGVYAKRRQSLKEFSKSYYDHLISEDGTLSIPQYQDEKLVVEYNERIQRSQEKQVELKTKISDLTTKISLATDDEKVGLEEERRGLQSKLEAEIARESDLRRDRMDKTWVVTTEDVRAIVEARLEAMLKGIYDKDGKKLANGAEEDKAAAQEAIDKYSAMRGSIASENGFTEEEIYNRKLAQAMVLEQERQIQYQEDIDLLNKVLKDEGLTEDQQKALKTKIRELETNLQDSKLTVEALQTRRDATWSQKQDAAPTNDEKIAKNEERIASYNDSIAKSQERQTELRTKIAELAERVGSATEEEKKDIEEQHATLQSRLEDERKTEENLKLDRDRRKKDNERLRETDGTPTADKAADDSVFSKFVGALKEVINTGGGSVGGDGLATEATLAQILAVLTGGNVVENARSEVAATIDKKSPEWKALEEEANKAYQKAKNIKDKNWTAEEKTVIENTVKSLIEKIQDPKTDEKTKIALQVALKDALSDFANANKNNKDLKYNTRTSKKGEYTWLPYEEMDKYFGLEKGSLTKLRLTNDQAMKKLGGHPVQAQPQTVDVGDGGVSSIAREETLSKILEVLNAFKSDGVKTTGKTKSENKEKTPKKTEAELIKERALKDKDAVLGIAADSKIKKKYTSLVSQLESATELKDIKAFAQKVSALGFNIKKEAAEWEYKTSSIDGKTRVYDIGKKANLFGKRRNTVLKSMEDLAQNKFNPDGKEYKFLNFDGKKLSYQLTDIRGNVEKVTMEWSELNNQVAITSDKAVSKLDGFAGKLSGVDEKFEAASQMGYLDKNNDKFKTYENALKAVDAEIEAIAKQEMVSDEDLARVEQLRATALQAADEVNKQISANKRLYTGTTEMNAATKQYGNLEASGILDKTDLAIVEKYKAHYAELTKLHADLKSGKDKRGLLDENAQKELLQASLETKKLGKELEKAAVQSERLKQLREDSGTYKTKDGQIHDIGKEFKLDGSIDKYAAMRKVLEELGATNIKVDTIHQKATGTIRHNDRLVSDLEVSYDELTDSLSRYHKQERESLTGIPAFLNGFQKKFNSIMQYLSMTMSIHRILSEVRKGIQYVREIDDALVELRKVTDETQKTYDKFLQTAAKTGEKLGATISDVTRATATFAKLGYAMSDASEMAEAALVYKNVGDNIASAEDAADSIISTLKGFNKENLEAMSIVDRFNEVGNRFAITSQGIGEALKLSASALSEGGNTLDESIGIITAANEVVNDPSSVGRKLCRH